MYRPYRFLCFFFKLSTIIYLNTQLPILISSLLCLVTWVFFILNRDVHSIKSSEVSSVLVKEFAPASYSNEISFSRSTLVSLLLALVLLSELRFISGFMFFEQLVISPFTRDILLVALCAYTLLQYITYLMSFYKVTFSLEYLYSLSTFFIISPLLYLSSSLYSFFFLLEVLGVLVVLLFSSLTYLGSKKDANEASYKSSTINPTPAKLVISLFTQFWISFFSSVLLALFLVLSLFIWNTSMYFELNTIISSSSAAAGSTHTIFVVLWDFLFIFGFFLKAGIAPFHLFKIEIYRGLPFFTVFIYTFLYLIYASLYLLYAFYSYYVFS